jgi:diguanylate cyclase
LHPLRAVTTDEAAALDLRAKLSDAKTDPELAAILEQTADLIRAHGETLASERLQAAAVLSDVTTRLEEMAVYLDESGDETRTRFADSASVNDTVMSQVRELTAEADGATELRVLQTKVSARLQVVTRQVLDFRSREEGRLLEHTGRAERMRTRIADLEREAQELHSKLAKEKHGARLDPLTRLANRKSFDERFAEEIERRARGDLSVTLLLWDLDNFKVINDTYGHRAGDRVLQSVATCFMSGLRAEDFVARIGGEEFVVLLTGLPYERALHIAEDLRMSVEALRFHFRGTPIRVTVSCGLTELRSAELADAAFDRADAALYRAKNGGKNLCVAA